MPLLPSSNCTLEKKEVKETRASEGLNGVCPQASPVTSLAPEPCSL